MARMMQGDSYFVDFKLYDMEKNPIPRDTILDVAITIGGIRKVYDTDGTNKISYDSDRDVWRFPMSQQESLGLATNIQVDVYVEFMDGSRVGTRPPHIQVTPAQIKEGF